MNPVTKTVVQSAFKASCGSFALLNQAISPLLREMPMIDLFTVVKDLGDAPVVFENAKNMTYADVLRKAAEVCIRAEVERMLKNKKGTPDVDTEQ